VSTAAGAAAAAAASPAGSVPPPLRGPSVNSKCLLAGCELAWTLFNEGVEGILCVVYQCYQLCWGPEAGCVEERRKQGQGNSREEHESRLGVNKYHYQPPPNISYM